MLKLRSSVALGPMLALKECAGSGWEAPCIVANTQRTTNLIDANLNRGGDGYR